MAPAAPSFDAVEYARARHLTTAGLFLGWAGPSLALGGTVAGLTDAPTIGRDPRRWVEVSLVGGAALSVAGLGLQSAGSAWTRSQFADAGLPTRARRRAIAWGVSATSAALAGLVGWRILEPEPDGWWLPVGGGFALGGTLGATILHLGLRIDADNLAEDELPLVRLRAGPGSVRLDGRF